MEVKEWKFMAPSPLGFALKMLEGKTSVEIKRKKFDEDEVSRKITIFSATRANNRNGRLFDGTITAVKLNSTRWYLSNAWWSKYVTLKYRARCLFLL